MKEVCNWRDIQRRYKKGEVNFGDYGKKKNDLKRTLELLGVEP